VGAESVAEEGCLLHFGASGARGSQRELTTLVEKQRASVLGTDIDALADIDNGVVFAKTARYSVDKNSSVWVSNIPTLHLFLGPAEFRETAALYFGAPSPVATALEGQRIWGKGGENRGVCDKFGLKLGSLNLDKRFTTAHDAVKFAIARALQTLGVNYMSEVHGLFTPVIPPGNMANARRAMQGRPCGGGGNGARQGLVPDFKVEIEGLNAGAAGTAALVELKMLRCGSTPRNPIGGSTYATRGITSVLSGHRRAVHKRAETIQREREADARKIDRLFCDTPQGQDGPVLQRLRSFGPVIGAVVGHFGEWNDGLERLLSAACSDAAPRMCALFGLKTVRASHSYCARLFRNEVAWAALNANAKLRLERAEFVGWDARTAGANRAQQARADNAQRERAAWAATAFRNERQGLYGGERAPRGG